MNIGDNKFGGNLSLRFGDDDSEQYTDLLMAAHSMVSQAKRYSRIETGGCSHKVA